MAGVSFGDWLKRRRNGLGLTQAQLALQIHCSTSSLRKFELEERRPSADTVEQLANIFDIPTAERKNFLRFARGDWHAFADGVDETEPWRLSNADKKSNLPSLFSSFIGREKDQSKVINLIKKNRLVTIAGPGGIGKTRLAIQVGHQLQQSFSDGVWFIPLDSISDPDRVPGKVALVFGIREIVDSQVTDTLINILRLKNILIILDNCEHLLDACTQLITFLLTHCPNLKILTTSREILQLEGEATLRLPSLSIPRQSVPFEKINEYESIRLFVERAVLTLSSFQLTRDNAHAVADLCRSVDGIPLAIELIVARMNSLSVDEILDQLKKSFTILAEGRRTTLSHHETLRDSIDWSWSLLTDEEQIFFRQLAVFAGGWTLESAQSVCDGDTLNLINSLSQKSLINVKREMGSDSRYYFHEMIRQYAYEKLFEAGEEEIIRGRHLQYFVWLSEQIDPGLHGPKQKQWFIRAEHERDNFRLALQHANKTDLNAGLTISGRLKDVWERYDIRAGVFWLEEFLNLPESKNYPIARARALCTLGWLIIFLRVDPKVRAVAEESLALFIDQKDRSGEIDALTLLGATYSYVDDYAQGAKLFQQALSIAQSVGDLWRQANIYYHLGWDNNNDFQLSLIYFEMAADLFSEAGDRRSRAVLVSLIGYIHVLTNDIEIAQKDLDEAAMLYPIDDILSWEQYQTARSTIALKQADHEKARMLLQEILDKSERSGNRWDYALAQVRLGYVALRRGDFIEARDFFFETVQIFQKTTSAIIVVYILEGMAELFVAIDNPLKAARLIGWADATREEIKNPRPPIEQLDTDKVIAACILELGDVEYTDAYRDGQKMKLDDAVTLAFKEDESTISGLNFPE